MVKGKLSVIVPFVNEHPQAAFTIQALYCELRDKADFEIIAVDNWCSEVERQGRKNDSGHKYLESIASLHKWLKLLSYSDKLSHWNAKNFAINNSDGEVLLFCDAHCIPSHGSILSMLHYYLEHCDELNGTLHLPLSYMLDQPGRELIYKLVTDVDKSVVHYSFTSYSQYKQDRVIKVPCMSTCGMMMSRQIYDQLGGWPKELGIYGGGENFINFTLATMGKSINIFPTRPLFHYAAPRGYNWNYYDYHRNRCIASYMYGNEDFAHTYLKNVKGHPLVLQRIYTDVIVGCAGHKEHVKKSQVIGIKEWVKNVAPDIIASACKS